MPVGNDPLAWFEEEHEEWLRQQEEAKAEEERLRQQREAERMLSGQHDEDVTGSIPEEEQVAAYAEPEPEQPESDDPLAWFDEARADYLEGKSERRRDAEEGPPEPALEEPIAEEPVAPEPPPEIDQGPDLQDIPEDSGFTASAEPEGMSERDQYYADYGEDVQNLTLGGMYDFVKDSIVKNLVGGYHETKQAFKEQAAVGAAQDIGALKRGESTRVDRGIATRQDGGLGSFLTANVKAEEPHENRVQALQNNIDEYIVTAAEHEEKAKALPLSDATQDFLDESRGVDVWTALGAAPLTVIAELGARSGYAMVPGMAAGVAGGAVAGPVGFAAGMGLGSARVDYAHTIVGKLKEAGVDFTNAESIINAVEDDELMLRAQTESFVRSVIVGGWDGASALLGGKMLAPAMKNVFLQEVTNLAAQMPMQALFGMAGEFFGQTIGEGTAVADVDFRDVLAEGVGELSQAPIETGGAVLAGARGSTENRARQLAKAIDSLETDPNVALQKATAALQPPVGNIEDHRLPPPGGGPSGGGGSTIPTIDTSPVDKIRPVTFRTGLAAINEDEFTDGVEVDEPVTIPPVEAVDIPDVTPGNEVLAPDDTLVEDIDLDQEVAELEGAVRPEDQELEFSEEIIGDEFEDTAVVEEEVEAEPELVPQDASTVRRSKDFRENGEYEVTLPSGRKERIYRDTNYFSGGAWYRVGAEPNEGPLGFTRKETVEELEKQDTVADTTVEQAPLDTQPALVDQLKEGSGKATVYRGAFNAPAQDIQTVDLGPHFSTDQTVAEGHIGETGEAGSFNITVDKPLLLREPEGGMWNNPTAVANLLSAETDSGVTLSGPTKNLIKAFNQQGDISANPEQGSVQRRALDSLVNDIKRAGYDSIIYNDDVEGGTESIIVLDPDNRVEYSGRVGEVQEETATITEEATPATTKAETVTLPQRASQKTGVWHGGGLETAPEVKTTHDGTRYVKVIWENRQSTKMAVHRIYEDGTTTDRTVEEGVATRRPVPKWLIDDVVKQLTGLREAEVSGAREKALAETTLQIRDSSKEITEPFDHSKPVFLNRTTTDIVGAGHAVGGKPELLLQQLGDILLDMKEQAISLGGDRYAHLSLDANEPTYVGLFADTKRWGVAYTSQNSEGNFEDGILVNPFYTSPYNRKGEPTTTDEVVEHIIDTMIHELAHLAYTDGRAMNHTAVHVGFMEDLADVFNENAQLQRWRTELTDTLNSHEITFQEMREAYDNQNTKSAKLPIKEVIFSEGRGTNAVDKARSPDTRSSVKGRGRPSRSANVDKDSKSGKQGKGRGKPFKPKREQQSRPAKKQRKLVNQPVPPPPPTGPPPVPPGGGGPTGNGFNTVLHQFQNFSLPTPGLMRMLEDNSMTLGDKLRWSGYYGRQTAQDRMLSVKKTQEAIHDAGGTISDFLDVYGREELIYGKVGWIFKRFERGPLKKISNLMNQYGISRDQLNEFMEAQHAQARNEWVASFNKKMQDGGSGMTTDEANAILDRIDREGKRHQYDRIFVNIRKIQKDTRKNLVKYGLLPKELVKTWEEHNTFNETYVPLKGFAEILEEEFAGAGKGFDIRGTEVHAALGRESRASDIFANITADFRMSVMRGEKNLIGNALLALAETYPNPNLWVVNEIKSKLERNKETGWVEEKIDYQLDNNLTFVTKRDGKAYRIVLKNPSLATAMKNLGIDNSGGFVRFAARITRFMSQTRTTYSPEFPLLNFGRDIQTAIFNLVAEHGTGFALKVAKQSNLRQAGAAIWRANRDLKAKGRVYNRQKTVESRQDWDKWAIQYYEDGGAVDFFSEKSIDGYGRDLTHLVNIQKKTAVAKVRRGIRAANSFVQDANASVENAARLSAYRFAIEDLGMTRHQAAKLAKNLTVNFNKKGTAGPTMNALYMFYGATVQSVARFASFAKSKRGRRLMYSIAGFAFSLTFANELGGGDDEDGESFYSKIPDYIKSRYTIIMIPEFLVDYVRDHPDWGFLEQVGSGDKVGLYWKFVSPYGYNLPYIVGESAAAMQFGGDPEEQMLKIVDGINNSFNPMGEGSILAFLSPSITDPIAEIVENRNFFGGEIYNDNEFFNFPIKAQAEQGRRGTHENYHDIAQMLNKLGGKNKYQESRIDMYPESIRHLIEAGGGGTWQFAERIVENLTALPSDEGLSPTDAVFLRKFVGKTNAYADSERYFRNIGVVNSIASDLEKIRIDVKNQEQPYSRITEFKDDHAEIFDARLPARVKNTQRRLKSLRKRRRDLENKKDAYDKERRIEAINKDIHQTYRAFNKEYNKHTLDRGWVRRSLGID
jgi:hypothetical protein